MAAPAVRAETFGFADPVRVGRRKSTEWQRLAAEVQADQDTKKREDDAAFDAARKAKPADAQALADKFRQLAKINGDDLLKHYKEARGTFEKRRAEVAAALEREKHVTLILAPPAVPNPKRDLTDELIKRLNASDVQAIVEENTRLKAEKAALAKPAPPTVPPAPPIQPAHVQEK